MTTRRTFIKGVGASAVALAAAGALPVLRSRADAVEEAVDQLFGGRLTEGRVGGRWDAHGAAQGRAAADRARLRAGELSA